MQASRELYRYTIESWVHRHRCRKTLADIQEGKRTPLARWMEQFRYVYISLLGGQVVRWPHSETDRYTNSSHLSACQWTGPSSKHHNHAALLLGLVWKFLPPPCMKNEGTWTWKFVLIRQWLSRTIWLVTNWSVLTSGRIWQACRLYQRSVMMAPDHGSLSLNLMWLCQQVFRVFEPSSKVKKCSSCDFQCG